MKDKFETDELYYILEPGTLKPYLVKACGGYPQRKVSFFFCDKEGWMNWEDIDHAYNVKLRAPDYSEMRDKLDT